MTDHLDSVKRAARAKTRADHAYRAAISAALQEGFSYAEIAAALKVSRQAVRQLAIREVNGSSHP